MAVFFCRKFWLSSERSYSNTAKTGSIWSGYDDVYWHSWIYCPLVHLAQYIFFVIYRHGFIVNLSNHIKFWIHIRLNISIIRWTLPFLHIFRCISRCHRIKIWQCPVILVLLKYKSLRNYTKRGRSAVFLIS